MKFTFLQNKHITRFLDDFQIVDKFGGHDFFMCNKHLKCWKTKNLMRFWMNARSVRREKLLFQKWLLGLEYKEWNEWWNVEDDAVVNAGKCRNTPSNIFVMLGAQNRWLKMKRLLRLWSRIRRWFRPPDHQNRANMAPFRVWVNFCEAHSWPDSDGEIRGKIRWAICFHCVHATQSNKTIHGSKPTARTISFLLNSHKKKFGSHTIEKNVSLFMFSKNKFPLS